MRDAARLMPFLGAFLWLLPLLWAPPPGQVRSLSQDAVYVFVVWLLLIACSMILGRLLASRPMGDDPAGAEDRE
jgi:hypothetical protein